MSSIESIGSSQSAALSQFNMLFMQYRQFDSAVLQEKATSLKESLKQGQLPGVRRMIDNVLQCMNQGKGTTQIQIQTFSLMQEVGSSAKFDVSGLTGCQPGRLPSSDDAISGDKEELMRLLESIISGGIDSLDEVSDIIAILGALGGGNLGFLGDKIKTALEEFAANAGNNVDQTDFSSYIAFISTLKMMVGGHANSDGFSPINVAQVPRITPVSAPEKASEADVQTQKQTSSEAPEKTEDKGREKKDRLRHDQHEALLKRSEQMGHILNERKANETSNVREIQGVAPIKAIDNRAPSRRVMAIEDMSRTETGGPDKGFQRARTEDQAERHALEKGIHQAIEQVADEYTPYFVAGMLSILHLLPKVEKHLEDELDELLTKVDRIETDLK